MTKRVLKEFFLHEISAVTIPAQTGAKAVIMKRRHGPFAEAIVLVKSHDPDWVSRIIKDAKSFDQVLEEQEEKDRVFEATSELYDKMWALQSAINLIIEDEELDGAGKADAIKTSIDQFQESIAESLPDISEAVGKTAKSTKTPALSGVFHAGKPGPTQSEQETSMAEKKMSGDVEAKLADLQKKVDEQSAALKKAEALAKMTDVQKAHYAGLESDDAKASFLKLSSDEQASEIKKAADADDFFERRGTIIRKSVVGEAVYAVMKADKEEAVQRDKEIAKAREETALVTFTKQAEDEYSHLTGSPGDKGKALRALSKLGKEGEAALAMLKGAEAAVKDAGIYREIGTSNAGDAGEKSTLMKSIEAEQAKKKAA